MNKWFLILGGILAAAFFTYGSLAVLVNQGLSLPGAVVMLVVIVVSGLAMVRLLR